MTFEDNSLKQVKQIAALPIRWDREGHLQVLMVTSRGTGRWVMPQGWLMITSTWKCVLQATSRQMFLTISANTT